MTDKESRDGCIGTCFVILIFATIAFSLGMSFDNTLWQSSAVKEGHAEFYLDSNSNKQWRWLPANKPTAEAQ